MLYLTAVPPSGPCHSTLGGNWKRDPPPDPYAPEILPPPSGPWVAPRGCQSLQACCGFQKTGLSIFSPSQPNTTPQHPPSLITLLRTRSGLSSPVLLMLGSSKMFKLVKNDTHWLAFGVSKTLIVAQAVDLKNLAGFQVLLPCPLHHN